MKWQLKYRIQILAICYFFSLTTYSATTSMMYALYSHHQLSMLALFDGIFAFLGFGLSNPLILQTMRKINIKKSIIVGFMGIGIFEFNLVVTLLGVQNNLFLVSSPPVYWTLNIITSTLSGISNSLIWTSLPVYIQAYCQEMQVMRSKESENSSNEQINTQNEESKKKTEMTAMMGSFWSIYMWSVVFGGIINIFILGYVNIEVYSLIVVAFIGASIIVSWMLLHEYEIPQLEETGIKNELKQLLSVLKKGQNILVYNYLGGLILSFYIIFINKIIQKSLPQSISQSDLNIRTALVFLAQGIISILMGLAQSQISSYYNINKRKSMYIAFILIQICLLLTVISFNILDHSGDQYYLCFLVIVAWGIAQIHIKTSVDAYVKSYLKGKVHITDYSLGIFMYSLGSITVYAILMIQSQNIQLITVILWFICVSMVWVMREPQQQQSKSIQEFN